MSRMMRKKSKTIRVQMTISFSYSIVTFSAHCKHYHMSSSRKYRNYILLIGVLFITLLIQV